MPQKNKRSKNPVYIGQEDDVEKRVRAKGPEQAAKKIYRMNKALHGAAGHVRVVDETGAEWSFKTTDWCERYGNKFVSKPSSTNIAREVPESIAREVPESIALQQ